MAKERIEYREAVEYLAAFGPGTTYPMDQHVLATCGEVLMIARLFGRQPMEVANDVLVDRDTRLKKAVGTYAGEARP